MHPLSPAPQASHPATRLLRLSQKIRHVMREETMALNLRMLLLQSVAGCLPLYVGGRLRGPLLRLAGIKVGHHTTIMGWPCIVGSGPIQQRLTIGNYVRMNIGCHFDLNDRITIESHAGLGHEVMILTTSHVIGGPEQRVGELTTAPVRIGAGAWLGARAVVLPGVSIGAGSIVASSALVNKDVPPHTLVAGVPARPIRQLPT